MKNLLPVLLVLFAFCAFAQSPSLPIDMDDPADDAWVGDGGCVYSLETVLFSPDNVGKIDGGGDQWNSRVDLALGTYIDMTTANKTFTFDFYTTTTDVMTGLFQIGDEENNGYPIEMQFTTDGVIGWQTITLDFTNADNGYPWCQTCPDPQPVVYGQYAQVSIFTNFGSTATGTYYFDDIAGAANGAAIGADPAPASPPVPQPTALEENVISVFSDVYTDLTTTWHPAWGQTTIYSDEIIAGTSPEDHVSKLKNFGYEGITFPSNSVALMEYVHFDVWSYDETSFKFFLLAGGPEPSVTKPLATNQWNSFDVPLSEFVGGDLSNVTGIKLESGSWAWPNGTSLVYVDNIYFWKEPASSGTDATLSDLLVDGTSVAGFSPDVLGYDVVLPYGTTVVPTVTATTNDPLANYVVNDAGSLPGTSTVDVTAQDLTTMLTYSINFTIASGVPSTAAPDPTHAEADVLSIYSDGYTDLPGTNFNPWWSQATTVTVDFMVAGNNTLRYENFNYQGTNLGSDNGGVPQDVSGYEYIHVDFWTTNATALNFFIIDQNPGEVSYSLPITPGQWIGVDIPLSHYSDGGENLTDIHQFKVDGGSGSPTAVWFDNWYFWKTPSATATTWNGNLDDNWHDAGNWDNGVPASSTDVTIPGGLSNYPLISGGLTNTCGMLNIAAGASLSLATDGYLTVAGNTTIDGGLYIESNASGASGSFIDNGTITGSGNFYFNRDMISDGALGSPDGWHLISSPLGTEFSNYDMYDYYINTWDESTHMFMSHGGEYPCIPAAEIVLSPVMGWSVKQDLEYGCEPTLPGTGNILDFDGAVTDINTGNEIMPATYTNGGTAADGFNLLGNPYPSGIDASLISFSGDLDGSVNTWNDATNQYDEWTIAMGSHVIAPTQGFWVRATNNTSLSLDNNVRAHGGTFYKESMDNVLQLSVTGDGSYDETFIRFMEGTSTAYDLHLDGHKMFSSNVPSLYTTSGGQQLAIDVQSATDQVPMSFSSETSGSYIIEAFETSDFTDVYLQDLKTGEVTDLLTGSYEFTHTDGVQNFIIHFATVGINEISSSTVKIWAGNNSIVVNVDDDVTGEIAVYNLLGQEVTRTSIESSETHIPVLDLNTNYYIVKVISDNNDVVTGKVYVK